MHWRIHSPVYWRNLYKLTRAIYSTGWLVIPRRRLFIQSAALADNTDVIRLIDLQGKNLGTMTEVEAKKLAKNDGLELKEIAKKSETITNKVYKMVSGEQPASVRHEQAIRKPIKKTSSNSKELTMKSQIQDNDLNVKAKKLQQFLDRGCEVTIKISKPFRVTTLPADTYERLVAKLDCDVIAKGAPRAKGNLFRTTIVKSDKS